MLRENEIRTRLALIDPLLRTLGWDVSDPTLVTPEYEVKGRRADYALLRPDGRPAVTVEAKKLGELLTDKHREQMLNYANMSGIEYTALTDGNHWELYSVFRRVPLEERRMLEVSIANSPAHESALKLLILWHPNLASGQPVPANPPISRPPPSPPITKSPGWIALSEYRLPAGTPYPKAIRFWDGSEQKLRRWCEVITVTIEKVCKDELLPFENIPIKTRGGSYIVSTEPKHPSGEPFIRHRMIPGKTPLYVNVNLSAYRVRQYTKELLRICGKSPGSVYLRAAQ